MERKMEITETFHGPALKRDPVAERVTVVMAAIENARVRMSAYRDDKWLSQLYSATAADELEKILNVKDAYDRAVKS